MKKYVISCLDQDGYYVPLLIVHSMTEAKRQTEALRKKHADDSYLDVDFMQVDHVPESCPYFPIPSIKL